MKVKLEFSGKKITTKEQLLNLKTYIDKQNITGVKKVELTKTKAKNGEMGEGIVPSVTALVSAVNGPLTALASAVVEFVKNMRSEVKLIGESGQELCISAKLKKDDIVELITLFNANEAKARKKRVTKKEKVTETGS